MKKLDLNDRMDQLEKDIRKLEREMHSCHWYQGDQLEPEKESPPFGSWIK